MPANAAEENVKEEKPVEQEVEELTATTENSETETAEIETVETEVDLQTQLEAAQAEAAKNLDGWQRATAEMQNYKRRQQEQAGRRHNDTIAEIVSQIFPVLDDLDLAFQNVPPELNEKDANWVEGFNLVQRKLLKILEKNNVQPIESEGEFDPNLHEAITHEDSPDHESNTIIAELRKGYKLGERVLRPALVRVAQ